MTQGSGGATQDDSARSRSWMHAPDGILDVGADGVVVRANTRAREWFPDLAGGTHLADILGQDALAAYPELLEGTASVPIELPLRRPDGDRHVEVLTSRASTTPGSETTIVSLRDVTRRRHRQLEELQLQEQLRESQKLEALGRLAGGVAHDMNNLLGVVLNIASVLSDEVDGVREEEGAATDAPATPPSGGAATTATSSRTNVDTERVLEDLGIIRDAGKRARDLMQNLLGFARRGSYRFETLDVNRITGMAVDRMETRRQKTVTLSRDLEAELPPILGDEAQLQRAVENLVRNALEAVQGVGHLAVSTRGCVLTEAEAASLKPAIPPGRYTIIEVKDNGVGMDAETLERAFEPFFTTKAPGTGTGLGLSMVYGTMRDHYGSVRLVSEPEKGTTVELMLRAEETVHTAPTARMEPTPRIARPGQRTVLIIDDERLVRRAEERLFRRLGFETLTASNGRDGIDIYRAHRQAIVLVVLDMVMPGLDGHTVLAELQAIDAAVRVLVCTGFSKVRLDSGEGMRPVALLRKPFELDALVEKLAELQVHPPELPGSRR